jgi:hypothetical protein
MNIRIYLGSSALIVSLILMCSASSRCQTPSVAQGHEFGTLFDGFQLVLVDDLPAKAPIQQLDSSTLRNTYLSERSLTPGRVYIFRKTTKRSDEDLALNSLPGRLVKIGAQVLKAPKSSKDLIYPLIGGPLFVIQFEKDGHQGTMFNQVRTSSQPSEHWEELIFAYR